MQQLLSTTMGKITRGTGAVLTTPIAVSSGSCCLSADIFESVRLVYLHSRQLAKHQEELPNVSMTGMHPSARQPCIVRIHTHRLQTAADQAVQQ